MSKMWLSKKIESQILLIKIIYPIINTDKIAIDYLVDNNFTY